MRHIEKGSYILIIYLHNPQTITFGRLGQISFRSSPYAYVGSAMKGFNARLPRHLKKANKPHWHIDYLLQKASIARILVGESSTKNECRIAGALLKRFEEIPAFGSSDCRCKSWICFHPIYLGKIEWNGNG